MRQVQELHPISVRNFGCPCDRDNKKSRRTTKNTDADVRRTTRNFPCPSCSQLFHAPAPSHALAYLVPSTDNQKLGRTTRILNLVVRGATIIFSLIRTLHPMHLRRVRPTPRALEESRPIPHVPQESRSTTHSFEESRGYTLHAAVRPIVFE